MSETMRAPIAPIGWSIALHAVLAGLLFFGLTLPTHEPELVVLPIDAVVMDQAVLRRRARSATTRSGARRTPAARGGRGRGKAARGRAPTAGGCRGAGQGTGSDRNRAEGKGGRAGQAKAEQEAKSKADKEAQAKAAAEKKREVQDKRDRDQREADLRARLEDEETRTSAGFQSLKASYVRAIQLHVEQRWFEPPGVAQGLSCTIYVTQIPGGEVVGMRFGTCNGGAAVRQSIENAVRNASPLPAPPEPALFEREVELVFTPKESRR
jgi:colicin import membrane protein